MIKNWQEIIREKFLKNMDTKSGIEVSTGENSNVDGAIDDTEVCKLDEDEVQELEFLDFVFIEFTNFWSSRFQSNCNSQDKNENENEYEENFAIPEGEEHSNESTFGVEDFKKEIKVEEIDSTDCRFRGKVIRKNSMAHRLNESKQKIGLNDNQYYGRRLGRSTRTLKQKNYNERTESDAEETNFVRREDFFISEENHIEDEDEDKENCDQWTPANAKKENQGRSCSHRCAIYFIW